VGKKKAKSLKAQQAAKSANTSSKFKYLSVAALLVLAAAFGIHAYERNQNELHDLSAIGKGKPTVVQIHDPTCETCARLKRIVDKAFVDDDSPLFRLADITTDEGKTFQNRYNVTHSTLLYFDKRGKHVHTTQGLQTIAEVREISGEVFRR